jgi:hypothetical protein
VDVELLEPDVLLPQPREAPTTNSNMRQLRMLDSTLLFLRMPTRRNPAIAAALTGTILRERGLPPGTAATAFLEMKRRARPFVTLEDSEV